VETAQAAVARTLGALPPRAATAPVKPANVRFAPPAKIATLTHAGRADQAVTYVAFAGRDFSDPRQARAQRFAAELMQLRLTEEVRERLGASYSPTASDVASRVFPGFGYVSASAETPPAQTQAIFDLMESIGAELAAGRFDEDLMARARAPLVDQAITAEKTNGYWLGALERLQDDTAAAAATASRVSDYRTLSRAEVETAAKALFAPGVQRLKVTVTPAPTKN
jgi:zinc protease